MKSTTLRRWIPQGAGVLKTPVFSVNVLQGSLELKLDCALTGGPESTRLPSGEYL